VKKFLEIAALNTEIKIETCAILAGKMLNDSQYIITTLIVPRQEGEQDRCQMTDEISLFEAQIQYDLITIGWIHTHPQFDLFLSSVDLHNQLGYQQ
jgi:STAM-binding protein